MTVDETMRFRIHARLSELMGPEEADAMMANWLPWRDVATRDDLRVLSAELHTDMAELRGELRGEMAELRGELRGEMADLRTGMHALMISQTRWTLGYITALAAAIVTAGQLLQ